jgi:hypothetical protein
MATNVKRGFTRFYIVLAGLWALSCLVIYPRVQIKAIDVQYGRDTASCYATEQAGSNETHA